MKQPASWRTLGIAAALLCAVLLIVVFQQANHDAEVASAYQHATREANPSADPIAVYTLWLTIFTGILAGVSGWQGYLLYRAEGLTRRTADAALLQAKAAVRLQGPHIEIQSFFIVPAKIDFMTQMPVGTDCFWGCRLTNFGHSTAFITMIRYNGWINDSPLPAVPYYERHGKDASPIVIEPNHWYTFEAKDMIVPIDPVAANTPGGDRDMNFSYIRIAYRDVLGGVSEVGAIARYFDEIRWQPDVVTPGGFRILDIPDYTFRSYRYPESVEPESPFAITSAT